MISSSQKKIVAEVMLGIFLRNKKRVFDACDIVREDLDVVWRFIDGLYFEIAAPGTEIDDQIEAFRSDKGLAVDARFRESSGKLSDLVVCIEFLPSGSKEVVVLKSVVT